MKTSLMKCHSRFLITIYVSVGHEKIMNFKYSIVLSFVNFSMVNSIHHKFYFFFAIYSKTNIPHSLSNICVYVLALFVRTLDFGYLAVEAGIQ